MCIDLNDCYAFENRRNSKFALLPNNPNTRVDIANVDVYTCYRSRTCKIYIVPNVHASSPTRDADKYSIVLQPINNRFSSIQITYNRLVIIDKENPRGTRPSTFLVGRFGLSTFKKKIYHFHAFYC